MLKEKETKQKPKKNQKKRSLDNQKHRNNKIRKAKEILAKNKASLEQDAAKSTEDSKRMLPRRIFHVVRKIFLGLLIAVFAVVLVSFIVVRINGGTPDIFGYSIQRVTSGSMEPALLVGDVILCEKVTDPSEVEKGDIITFKGGSDFEYNNVTHRVVIPPMKGIDGEYVLTTKGDANSDIDGEINFNTVHSKFITKIDFLNKLYEFFLSPWGLIIFIAALIIIFFDELLTIVRVFTGNYEEDDDEDEESVKALMERIRSEEEEEKMRLEAEQERKRRLQKKYGSTSNKKKARRKKQKKNADGKSDKQAQKDLPDDKTDV